MSSKTTSNDALTACFDGVSETIEAVRAKFQAPSLSVGVICNGNVVYTRGFGYADEATKRCPDEKTVYQIGSCTKAFTATALALLSHRGLLNLDASVATYLPEFSNETQPKIGEVLTIKDLLSHCTGLSPMPNEVIVRCGEVIIRNECLIIPIMKHLPQTTAPRTEWRYNNWPYALASLLINKISGQPYAEFVKANIFEKLGMHRTSFLDSTDDNFARNYMVFSDGSKEPRSLPSLKQGDAFQGSGSIRSCVEDMLKWVASLIKSHSSRSQSRGSAWQSLLSWLGLNKAEELVSAMSMIQQPCFPLENDDKQNYALGLFHLQLPTSAIATVTNKALLPQPYTFGAGGQSQVAVGHTGELGGYLTSYWTFPESGIGVVVLCSSYNVNGDPSNVVAQVLAQAALDCPNPVDFLTTTETIVSNAHKRWTDSAEQWRNERQQGTRSRDLNLYAGTYINPGLELTISVTILDVATDDRQPADLQLRLNNEEEQTFDLKHYDNNRWSFMLESRDQCLRAGYSTYIEYWPAFVVSFDTQAENGKFRYLTWKLDGDPRVDPVRFTNNEAS